MALSTSPYRLLIRETSCSRAAESAANAVNPCAKGLRDIYEAIVLARAPSSANAMTPSPARGGGRKARQVRQGSPVVSLRIYLRSASNTFVDARPSTASPFFPSKSAIAAFVLAPIAPSGSPTS